MLYYQYYFCYCKNEGVFKEKVSKFSLPRAFAGYLEIYMLPAKCMYILPVTLYGTAIGILFFIH